MSTIVYMHDGAALTRVEEATAEAWIRETTPVARALVNWSEPIVDHRARVKGVPVAEQKGLYGPLMLTWFDDRTAEPTIYYLKEHRVYLQIAAACLCAVVAEEELCRHALADGSRMRIAITNDVLQVMAPTPPGKYSMVRHHALMFLAATLWLPGDQRDRWLQIYYLSFEAVRAELQGAEPVQLLLAEIEAQAFKAFEGGARRAGGKPISSQEDLARDDFKAIARYMVYCSAGVAVLAERLQRARRRGWSEEAWLAREVVRYRSDYYLLEELDDVRNGASRGAVFTVDENAYDILTTGAGSE